MSRSHPPFLRLSDPQDTTRQRQVSPLHDNPLLLYTERGTLATAIRQFPLRLGVRTTNYATFPSQPPCSDSRGRDHVLQTLTRKPSRLLNFFPADIPPLSTLLPSKSDLHRSRCVSEFMGERMAQASDASSPMSCAPPLRPPRTGPQSAHFYGSIPRFHPLHPSNTEELRPPTLTADDHAERQSKAGQ